jgi:hypothetical protein
MRSFTRESREKEGAASASQTEQQQERASNGFSAPAFLLDMGTGESSKTAEQALRYFEPLPILLQRKAIRDDNEVVENAPEALSHAAASNGTLLSLDVRNRFDRALGADLSGVRIHADSSSARAARSIRAKAYTVGQDQYFADGRYDPQSYAGQELLAHELVPYREKALLPSMKMTFDTGGELEQPKDSGQPKDVKEPQFSRDVVTKETSVLAKEGLKNSGLGSGSGAVAGLPRFLYGRASDAPIAAHPPVTGMAATDPDSYEREANAVAERFAGSAPVGGDEPTPLQQVSSQAARGGGQPLPLWLQSSLSTLLGQPLGSVRIHADAAAERDAQLHQAKAFTVGEDIVFNRRQYAPGTSAGQRLLAHEVAHVVQQRSIGPRVQRQPLSPDEQVCRAPSGPPASTVPPAAVRAPSSVGMVVEVRAQTLAMPGSSAAASTQVERIVINQPVLSSQTLTAYAVPLDRVQLGPEPDAPAMCAVPGGQSERDREGATALPISLPSGPPPMATEPRSPLTPGAVGSSGGPYRIPATVYIDGVAHTGVSITDGHVITSQYTHYAVGAGAITVLETPEGVQLIDAGVGREGGAALAESIVEQVRSVLRGRPILEVLSSHLHGDHTSLLPMLAEQFPIKAIRVNALQLADPRFTELRASIARAQIEGIARRVRAEVDATLGEWETTGEGAAIDPAERALSFEAMREARVRAALDAMAPIRMEILVPQGGALHMVNAPIGDVGVPAGVSMDTISLSEGYRDVSRGGHPRVAISDPDMPTRLRDRLANPLVREPDVEIDTNSTSYILDLPNGGRLLALPDIRTADFLRLQGTLEAELRRLRVGSGRPPVFQAWNMTHHMQAGWVVRASQLIGFIEMMRNLEVAVAGEGVVPNMVVVSAQGEPGNPAVRSMIDPGMVWFLRSLGMEVYIATGGRNIRLIEAVTARGQRVSGVVGQRYEGMRPSEPLLRRSEVAIQELQGLINQAEAALPSGRGSREPRSALRAQQKQWRSEKARIELARQAYLAQIEVELGRSPDAGPSRPAVAPPETATVEPAPAQAQALRDALAVESLRGLHVPPTAEIPSLSDTSMVLLRGHRDMALTGSAQSVLQSIERADALRARIQAGQASGGVDVLGFLNRVRLVGELTELRGLLQAQLETATGPSQTVIRDELALLEREIGALTGGSEGGTFSREPGTGRIIETRVLVEGSAGPERPLSAGERFVGAALSGAGRVLGVAMVYQLVRGEADLIERAEEQRAGGMETLAGTAHAALGVSIGVRMMQARPVGLGQFAILSALEIMETAGRDYESHEQFNTAVTYSAIRAGVNLALAGLGEAMMRSRNPWLMAAGFGIMFIGDPLLERLHVYDVIEQAYDFLPSEVTAANQRLRDLLREYRVIVGAVKLSERSDEELSALGTQEPAEVRETVNQNAQSQLSDSMAKEAEVLEALQQGYSRARTDYAGLIELDEIRNRFLTLRRRAHARDTRFSASSLAASDRVLRSIQEGLSLDDLTEAQIDALPQWARLHEAISELEGMLGTSSPDWANVDERQREIDRMMRHARYRLDPAPWGRRSAPLLSSGTRARGRYEEQLGILDARMLTLRQRIVTELSSGGEAPRAADATPPIANASLDMAEAGLRAFDTLVAHPPGMPFTAEELSRNSAIARTRYREHVDRDRGFRDYLARLSTLESALIGHVVEAQRQHGAEMSMPQTTVTGERLRLLLRTAQPDQLRARRQFQGIYFHDELPTLLTQIRQAEDREIAARLGEPANRRWTSPAEAAALEAAGFHGLSDLGSRLAQVPEMQRPAHEADQMQGIWRLEGAVQRFLVGHGYVTVNVPASRNALVGDLGPAREETTMRGHVTMRRVIALNAAAVDALGHGPTQVEMHMLSSISYSDVHR